ncbi:hypothetical protein C8Q80DRAFT_1264236 [Daedaleopsis nitida]|nr:hypothetical protein C8Q80DRAFT_1264236 [Daedaleopsis nitida]
MSSDPTASVVPAVPPAAFPQIPVDNTLGAWLLGVAGSLILNGMIFHQTYRYFKLYPTDKSLLKAWVLIVMVLETFTTILTLHTAYFYLVTKFWEPRHFFTASTVWSINLLPIPGSIAALVSQSFFARRVWIIAPKLRVVVCVATILIVGNVGALLYRYVFPAIVSLFPSALTAILRPASCPPTVICPSALSVKMFNSSNFADWLEFSWLASVGSSVQMVGDMTITATLIYVLHTSRPGINSRTDSMVDLLIMYAVSTGLITCIVHILNVAFSIAYSDNFIYAALSCILTKLYANTFLVALNTRKSLGTLIGAWDSFHLPSTTGAGKPSFQFCARKPHRGNLPMTASLTQPTAIELNVVTEVASAYDEDIDTRSQDRDKDASQVA